MSGEAFRSARAHASPFSSSGVRGGGGPSATDIVTHIMHAAMSTSDAAVSFIMPSSQDFLHDATAGCRRKFAIPPDVQHLAGLQRGILLRGLKGCDGNSPLTPPPPLDQR